MNQQDHSSSRTNHCSSDSPDRYTRPATQVSEPQNTSQANEAQNTPTFYPNVVPNYPVPSPGLPFPYPMQNPSMINPSILNPSMAQNFQMQNPNPGPQFQYPNQSTGYGMQSLNPGPQFQYPIQGTAFGVQNPNPGPQFQYPNQGTAFGVQNPNPGPQFQFHNQGIGFGAQQNFTSGIYPSSSQNYRAESDATNNRSAGTQQRLPAQTPPINTPTTHHEGISSFLAPPRPQMPDNMQRLLAELPQLNRPTTYHDSITEFPVSQFPWPASATTHAARQAPDVPSMEHGRGSQATGTREGSEQAETTSRQHSQGTLSPEPQPREANQDKESDNSDLDDVSHRGTLFGGQASSPTMTAYTTPLLGLWTLEDRNSSLAELSREIRNTEIWSEMSRHILGPQIQAITRNFSALADDIWRRLAPIGQHEDFRRIDRISTYLREFTPKYLAVESNFWTAIQRVISDFEDQIEEMSNDTDSAVLIAALKSALQQICTTTYQQIEMHCKMFIDSDGTLNIDLENLYRNMSNGNLTATLALTQDLIEARFAIRQAKQACRHLLEQVSLLEQGND